MTETPILIAPPLSSEREALECLKVQAEIDKLAAEKANLVAELRRNTAYAETAEAQARLHRVNAQQAERQEAIAQASNHLAREYRFEDVVYDESVDLCLTQLAIWHRQTPECDIKITFTSPGGVVTNGLALFDQIALYSKRTGGTHKMTGVVSGMAASMAGILTQAFDHRIQYPNADLMIHQVSSWAEGSLGELQDKMDYLNQLNDRVAEIFIKRSGGKCDRAQFDSIYNRRASYLDAKRALAMGFIDEIAYDG